MAATESSSAGPCPPPRPAAAGRAAPGDLQYCKSGESGPAGRQPILPGIETCRRAPR